MNSIRVFLVVSLLATLTLTIFLSALHGYRSSMSEAQSVFDDKLANTARLLAVMHEADSGQESISGPDEQLAFQVWDAGVLGKHSSQTPTEPIAPFEPGYRYRNFSEHRWRTYAMRLGDTDHWVITADRVDIRNVLAEDIILKSVVPVVAALPVAGLLAWIIVGYGLSPLQKLVGRLLDKRADDLSPLPVDGQSNELAQVTTSINSLLQRLEASFSREKQFTANAAHELRTPISALKIHLHNLSMELPEKNHELEELESATQRMHNVVEQVLALHRTSPELIKTQFVKIDLHELVRDYLGRKYCQFEEKQQQIELDGHYVELLGDSFALETLVRNLLDNACKYTPVGGKIRVLVHKKGGRILLEVHDSGPGIPEQQYERVFDRFYRLNGDQHASGVAGCGLGLSIVKHIADLHHASVRLGKSMYSDGLAVTVSFPLAGDPAAEDSLAEWSSGL